MYIHPTILLMLLLSLVALFVFLLWLPAIWEWKHPKDIGPREFPDQTLFTPIDIWLDLLENMEVDGT
jgi:hypothetical protein